MISHQLILFGPPGTSKSYVARHEKAASLAVQDDDLFPVAFHPEFSYGEFVARLLPLSKDGGGIEYRVHAGPLVRALARAYAQLGTDARTQKNVALLVDEINRGNCAEIFGDVFQLLDRDDEGWSSYDLSVSELVIKAVRAELGLVEEASLPVRVQQMLADKKLRLPPNLYVIGTMNTSDESIFYMDSAFKRRWNFEFCPAGFARVPAFQRQARVWDQPELSWEIFLDALNAFILTKCNAPKIDDKLVGPWFIKARKAGATVATRYAERLAKLKDLASKVTINYEGADNSRKFEVELLDFIAHAPETLAASMIMLAGYKGEDGKRVFKAIAHDPDVPYPYYYSNQKFGPQPSGMLIEDFLSRLGELSADASHRIAREDIVGKLFLYLWDNVFDRDKTPLLALLGLQRHELRTFGQFADQLEQFVTALCVVPAPAATAAG